MMPASAPTVFVIDDDTLVRASIQGLLKSVSLPPGARTWNSKVRSRGTLKFHQEKKAEQWSSPDEGHLYALILAWRRGRGQPMLVRGGASEGFP